MNKLSILGVGVALIATTSLFTGCAKNSINGVEPQSAYKGYNIGNKEIHEKLKKAGYEASVQEVEDVVNGKKARWAVVDIRTKDEYLGATIKGVKRSGREAPELAIEEMFLNVQEVEKDGKKSKTYKGSDIDGIILMCRTGTRAAYDWAAYSFAGFGENVKIFSLVNWVEACKPVRNGNSGKTETALLADKKIKLIEATDGFYYKDSCFKAQ